jgi:hypothetical protein
MNKKQKYVGSKLYFFVHSYINGIRAGIQATHAAKTILRKHLGNLNPARTVTQAHQVEKWADKDETVILLEGGVTSEMNRVKRLVSKTTTLPWAVFREPDCGNMVTAIAVVVPDDFHVIHGKKGYMFFDLLRNSRLKK